jgi:hypothetical protein
MTVRKELSMVMYTTGPGPAIPAARPRKLAATRRYGPAYTREVRGLRQAVQATVHEVRGRSDDKVDDVGCRVIDHISLLGPAELHVLELTCRMLVRAALQ